MRPLAEIYHLFDFPRCAEIPPFRDRHPIGPDFALGLSHRLMLRGSKAECLDFDTHEIGTVNKDTDITGAGDRLYLIYKNPEEWIYIFGSDLAWGIVLSNIDFGKAEGFDDLESSGIDFAESYARRTTSQSQYYEGKILSDWARVAGLASPGS